MKLGLQDTTRGELLNAFGLVKTNGIILDMVKESREGCIGIGRTNGELGELFRGLKLRNAHGKNGLGRDQADKPNALLGLGSGLDKDVIKIQDFGGPSVHEGKTGLFPCRIKPKSAQAFFEFRGSKESSR